LDVDKSGSRKEASGSSRADKRSGGGNSSKRDDNSDEREIREANELRAKLGMAPLER
jgi:hypothetical protein